MGVRGWFLIAMWLVTNYVAATECVELSQRKAFRAAFAVFRGTVVQVEPLHPEKAYPALVTFKADRGWKGPVTESMKVLVVGSLLVSYPFHEGETYIIYAMNDVPQHFENLPNLSRGAVVYGIGSMCLLRVRTDVDEESRRLGRGHPPKPGSIRP
jgi:hypothetical protein